MKSRRKSVLEGAGMPALLNQSRDRPGMIMQWLRLLRGKRRGRPIDQLDHCLQAATRAADSGASAEMIVAALCHDIGKIESWERHAELSAHILAPYVSSSTAAIVASHQVLMARGPSLHTGELYPLRSAFHRFEWYDAAIVFAELWDDRSYDPHFKFVPLHEFEALIERVFTSAVSNSFHKSAADARLTLHQRQRN